IDFEVLSAKSSPIFAQETIFLDKSETFKILLVFFLIFDVTSSKAADVSSSDEAAFEDEKFNLSTFFRRTSELFCRVKPFDLFSINIFVIVCLKVFIS